MTFHRAYKALFLVLALGALGLWFFKPFAFPTIETMTVWIEGLGILGPAAIIALMALAVVASPIPSAPIAVVAGAVFGKMAGMIYVALGAEIGAVIAFSIARVLGREAMERLLGVSGGKGLLGSQNALTFAIFASRLMPFISFDMMSYAAGLSRLHIWRFLLATFMGILPASFALAFMGSEAISGQATWALWAILGLGLVTCAPIILAFTRRQSPTERK